VLLKREESLVVYVYLSSFFVDFVDVVDNNTYEVLTYNQVDWSKFDEQEEEEEDDDDDDDDDGDDDDDE